MDYNVSGAMIVFNEESVLRRSLTSLKKFTDEIILIDSFSTDNTLKIAEEFGCKIFSHEFDNHRDQKNRAIEKCTKDWIFLLDADEYLDSVLEYNIQSFIKNDQGIDAFGFPRKNYLDGDGPRGFPDFQTRLFHGHGKIFHSGHPFHHKTDTNCNKSSMVMGLGTIIHEKTLTRQKKQNRLYYSLRPNDYKEIPEGAEDIIINKNEMKDYENVNAYKDFLSKEGK